MVIFWVIYHVISQALTKVLEEVTAAIFRVEVKMQTVGSSERLIPPILHGIKTLKTNT
jgi:hypothetical protein